METCFIPGASDQVQLSTLVIAPESPKAIVQLVHGMAEHKERYIPFMNWLSERGYAAVICDLRGHGASVSSKEDLGYMGASGRQGLVDDVLQVTRWAKARFPGLPLFLFGHSMGSMIVRSYLKRYDTELAGLIVCGSPSANSAAGFGNFLAGCIGLLKGQHYRSAFLARLSTGSYDKKFRKDGITNAWLSTNRANVQAYNNDPLCGFTFTVNGYRSGLFSLMEDIYSEAGWQVQHPEIPIHFVAGMEDPCIVNTRKFSEAVSFLRKRGYRNVSAKLYPRMRHEILNETGREDVWRDLADLFDTWMAGR
ncbi:MAG: alpha/beta fold hydrolase [Bacteroidales bacterium]|nr:alpha/beta fold hydrolase [Bacteroidales bacterium]